MLNNGVSVDVEITIYSSSKNETEENMGNQKQKRKSDKVATEKKLIFQVKQCFKM